MPQGFKALHEDEFPDESDNHETEDVRNKESRPQPSGAFQLHVEDQRQHFLKTSESGDLSVNYSLDTFHQKFGELMQAYISGNMNKDQTVAEIEKAWVQLGSSQ